MKPRNDMWEIQSTVYTLTINYNLLLLFLLFEISKADLFFSTEA